MSQAAHCALIGCLLPSQHRRTFSLTGSTGREKTTVLRKQSLPLSSLCVSPSLSPLSMSLLLSLPLSPVHLFLLPFSLSSFSIILSSSLPLHRWLSLSLFSH